MKFFVDYDFVNWNEYIRYERGNMYHANSVKQREKDFIVRKFKGKKYNGPYPVTLAFRAHFKDKRRDLDNYRLKGLIDGLVAAGVIKNDNLTCVNKIIIEAVIDNQVGVEVEIKPSKGGE